MKHLFIITFFVSLTLTGICQSDTISYWRVYMGDSIINEFSIISENPIVNLKSTDISKESRLTIKYYNDTPCIKCLTRLKICDLNDKSIAKVKGIGTNYNAEFLLYNLIKIRNKRGSGFKFYYQIEDRDSQLLFTLLIK
jgi:hypothetical protein